MTGKNASSMLRLADGSIDYQYYAAKGSMAKNTELKRVAGKLLGTSPTASRITPSILTVVLLALLF